MNSVVGFKPCCIPTAIGSMPHTDAKRACQIVLENFPEVPVWPQLPRLSLRENMYIQYSEGMPCVVMDEQRHRIFFDTSVDVTSKIEKFYERYLAKDIEAFALTPDYAQGFHVFVDILKKSRPKELRLLKGQVTGPISFGLTVTDENKKAIIYNEAIFDTVLKTLALKAKWQEREFTQIAPEDVGTLIFFDEPYLVSFGSAFVSLQRDQVINYLNECVGTIDGLSGVHCCGRTDWAILMDTKVDVVSFDAYNYFESLTLYPKELKEFLERGGLLAWGIVPTSEDIAGESTESLMKRFESNIDLLGNKGIDKELLLQSSFVTPSCGTGSLPVELAERVLNLTRSLSKAMREKY
ncbi:MAG: methionine synthase [Actinomycetota bacterium]|nr:methionine synthase [Actinomycetota bacterium]MDI6821578.1 methionine synthase [Actinomycetota bacterium]